MGQVLLLFKAGVSGTSTDSCQLNVVGKENKGDHVLMLKAQPTSQPTTSLAQSRISMTLLAAKGKVLLGEDS